MPLSPGPRQGNQIEHRMLSDITQTGRGRPLTSSPGIVKWSAKTQTETGLPIQAELDPAPDPTGIKITDAEWEALRLETAAFYGEWNYTWKLHQDQ